MEMDYFKDLFNERTSDVVLKTGIGLKTIFWGLGFGLGQSGLGLGLGRSWGFEKLRY